MKPYHNLSGVDRAKELHKAGFPEPKDFEPGQTWYDVAGHRVEIVSGNECLWAHYYFDTGKFYRKHRITGKPGPFTFYSPTEKEVQKWEQNK